MKHTLALVVCCSSTIVSAFTWCEPKPKESFNWHETDYLLAFGDSYTYVQGTFGLQNYSFIGDAQNFTFTPHQLLIDEIVQNETSTSAGWPNWLWDFVFAGSDVSTNYTPLHHIYTVPLVDQIKQWAAYARSYLPVKPAKALVAVFTGINDISDSTKYTYPRVVNTGSGNVTITGYAGFYDGIIGSEFEALEIVSAAGYKNFLFMGLPPLDKTPGNAISSKPLLNATMVHTYNSILSSHAANSAAKHPGTKAMVFDTYTFRSGILENPSQYGIVNTTSYCKNYNAPDIDTNYAAYGCLPIQEYFWHNTGHITWKIHEFMAKAAGEFL